jgi:hypothetical protein
MPRPCARLDPPTTWRSGRRAAVPLPRPWQTNVWLLESTKGWESCFSGHNTMFCPVIDRHEQALWSCEGSLREVKPRLVSIERLVPAALSQSTVDHCFSPTFSLEQPSTGLSCLCEARSRAPIAGLHWAAPREQSSCQPRIKSSSV